MKKILLTIALTAVCAGAFAQGKITMANDSNHLVVWGDSTKLQAADAGLAGTSVLGTQAPGNLLFVDLYGGSSAGTMTLQTTTVISATIPGGFGPVSFISPTLAGGVVATMQVQIRQSGFATAALAQAGQGYYGFSPIFTFKPSSSIAFNSIVNPGGTALSTWANGPIVVQADLAPVPEPSTFALAGLGAAAMLIFRRKK